MKQITIQKPDDWHLHLRDGKIMEKVVGDTAQSFARALVMPNLVPPIVNAKQAEKYRNNIINALHENNKNFNPIMTLYLCETTTPKDIENAVDSSIVKAVKLYPAGATTNSDNGVRDFNKITETLKAMEKLNMTLCVHGEVVDENIDIFDRENEFIETILKPMREQMPQLKIVMEHITTKQGIEYVKDSENTAGTITLHHLILNRNHILAGGIRPHYYCLPVAKRETHRLALVEAAVSGNPKFFLGTDSAPHTKNNKESECGCAGCYTALNAMPILTQIFENEKKLEKLEDFTSRFGAQFYECEINKETLTLTKQNTPVSFPKSIEVGEEEIVVFDPQFDIFWKTET